MPTIGSKVNQKEFDAIVEYANLCGETVSNIIRKVIITYATMLEGGFPYDDHPEYECQIPLPDNIKGEEEDKVMSEKINQIRRILGWREIEL